MICTKAGFERTGSGEQGRDLLQWPDHQEHHDGREAGNRRNPGFSVHDQVRMARRRPAR